MDITFNGSANQTVSGTGGTADFNTITINNTGAVNNNIVEVSSSSFTAAAGFLTLTDGVLKMSGSFTFSNTFFAAANYTIAAAGGLWINNTNVTVTAQSQPINLSGLLRVSSGTYNIGTGINDDMIYVTGSTIDIQGGALNIAGGLRGSATTSTTTYSQSGGTVTVATQGSSSATFGSFDIRAAGSSFTMSNGTIIHQLATATISDYQVGASTNNVTGGTVQFGNASTPADSAYYISATAPVFNLTLNATSLLVVRLQTNAHTVKGNVNVQTGATLDANNFNLSVAGNWVKNGTFTPGTATVTFNGAANQSIGGTTTTFNNLTINNGGATDGNIVSLAVNTAVGGALTVSDGILNQGASFNLTVTGTTTINSGGTLNILSGQTGNFSPTGAVTVNSGGGWEVFGGTGADKVVITLGGTVANAGLIHFDSGDVTCGDADNIQIRSSAAGTQRAWSGAGSFLMQDVDVQDQNKSGAPNITANSSTNAGNNTNWTFTANCNAVTEVTLASFVAASGDKQGVYLQWRTGYEARNLGFNIYREQGGRRAKVNSSLIAGSALMIGQKTALASGLSYAWLDTATNDSDFAQYWLEDVDLNGKTTLHGPISPTPGGKLPPQANALLLSKLNSNAATVRQQVITPTVKAQGGFGKAVVKAADSLQTQWDIAGQAGAKLMVRADGWYRITQPELVAAGFDVSRDTVFLQLFVDGNEVPIVVKGGASGHLESGDAIEFYAKAVDTISTDLRAYYLINGKSQGRRINVVNGGGITSSAQNFLSTIERKERSTYFAALKNGDADNWFGSIITTDAVTQTLAVRHFDTNSATGAALEIALQGVTSDAAHSVKVLLNGNDVGTINFNGQVRQVSTLPISNGALLDGNNTVTLEAQGGEMDVNLLDYVRLTYAHTFAADDDALLYTAAGQELVTVSGFNSPAIRALDITDPNNVKELAGTTSAAGGNHSVSVAAQDAGQRVLYVFADSAASHPARVAANPPSGWNRTNQVADLVIITHGNFAASLDPLKALRRSQGYAVAVADVEDLYDEFSFGARSPQAIKDFLARAKGAWKRAPRFVLLAGDASNDPKNYLGLGDSDFVPTRLIDTEQMETASDDWLVDFNNDGLPDLAVGRLPARTAGESTTMVTKIVDYARLARPEGALLVADRNDGFNFEATSGQIRALLPPSLVVQEVFRSAYDDETAHSQIVQNRGRGPKIVNYFGHGSFGLWRGNLLTGADAANLGNGPEYSFVIMMTCLNGQFQDPFGDGLAEALMKAGQGGALAAWASSALTDPGAQALLNKELFRQLFPGTGLNVQPLTLGEAVMRSKAASPDADARRTWILFGDPTTRLR
jgi:hypothetical protein